MITSGVTVYLGTADRPRDAGLLPATVIEARPGRCLVRFTGGAPSPGAFGELQVYCDGPDGFMRQTAVVEGEADGLVMQLAFVGPACSAERRQHVRVSFFTQVDRAVRELSPA